MKPSSANSSFIAHIDFLFSLLTYAAESLPAAEVGLTPMQEQHVLLAKEAVGSSDRGKQSLSEASSQQTTRASTSKPGRIAQNLKSLLSLDVNEMLLDLLGLNVISEDDFRQVDSIEEGPQAKAKCFIKILLRKNDKQVDEFADYLSHSTDLSAKEVGLRMQREAIGDGNQPLREVHAMSTATGDVAQPGTDSAISRWFVKSDSSTVKGNTYAVV